MNQYQKAGDNAHQVQVGGDSDAKAAKKPMKPEWLVLLGSAAAVAVAVLATWLVVAR